MHGQISQPRTVAQARTFSIGKSFADETPEQRLRHREIAWRDRQRKRRRCPRPKIFIRIRELERVFADRYGPVLPNDDAGLDDIFVMVNHLAHLNEPDQRIAAWLQRWAPWFGDAALIRAVMLKPLKWRADTLAKRIGLNYATRTRLRITMIGATDCGKAKRLALRKKRATARERARRAKTGAVPHATSAAQTQPWKVRGVSRATYYRHLRNETVETNSCAAHLEQMVLDAKQSHQSVQGARRARAARPECVVSELRGTEHIKINIPTELRALMPRLSARIAHIGGCFPRTGVRAHHLRPLTGAPERFENVQPRNSE